MAEHSAIVAEGMERVCKDFTKIAKVHGFKRAQGRKWVRLSDETEHTIHIARSGSSYGAPANPSIALQLSLASRAGPEGAVTHLSHHETAKIRRATGYGYHHRFNAETGSTYDRCLAELELFVDEVAEPWFSATQM